MFFITVVVLAFIRIIIIGIGVASMWYHVHVYSIASLAVRYWANA